MKIIKLGRRLSDKDKREVKRFECGRCGCVFEADNSEYKHTFYMNEDVFLCPCPNCARVTSYVISESESD